MKKSRMLLLFGGLFLMLVAYMGLCGRTFYMKPPMPDLGSLPDEAQGLARNAIKDSSLFRPEDFSLQRLTELLASPYESEPPPIRVVWVSGAPVILRSGQLEMLILFEGRDGWTFWSQQQDYLYPFFQ